MEAFVFFSGFFDFVDLVSSCNFLMDENRKLCEAPYNKTVDWAKWYIFWADERVVAKSHADSNYKLAKVNLLSKVCTYNLCFRKFLLCLSTECMTNAVHLG